MFHTELLCSHEVWREEISTTAQKPGGRVVDPPDSYVLRTVAGDFAAVFYWAEEEVLPGSVRSFGGNEHFSCVAFGLSG